MAALSSHARPRPSRRTGRITFALIASTGLAALALLPALAHEGHGKTESASFDPNAPKKVSPETAYAIGLATAEVDFGQVEDVVILSGLVRPLPDRAHAVAPRYSGIVRSIAVQPGDLVKRGDVLAEVESPEVAKALYDSRRLEAEYERLQAEVVAAESQVASLQIEVPAAQRAAELAESESARLTEAGESVSVNLLAQRQSEAVRARAQAGLQAVALQQARAAVESLRRQAEATKRSADALRATLPSAAGAVESAPEGAEPGLVRFLSPIDGVVVGRFVTPGQGIEAGASLLTIGEFSRVQVEGEVPERLVDRIVSVQNAAVRVRRASDGQQVAEGAVRFISPVIDASKRTAHLIMEADNGAGALRQGQFVELAVVLSQSQASVVVPASAVVKEGPLTYVFVKEKEYFRKKDVALGVRDDRIVEVKQGLVPGDVVAVNGAFSLSQLRGVVPGAAEPATPAAPATPTTPPAGQEPKPDGHGHTHG
jgi:RND family efflux transporter MFP subunit